MDVSLTYISSLCHFFLNNFGNVCPFYEKICRHPKPGTLSAPYTPGQQGNFLDPEQNKMWNLTWSWTNTVRNLSFVIIRGTDTEHRNTKNPNQSFKYHRTPHQIKWRPGLCNTRERFALMAADSCVRACHELGHEPWRLKSRIPLKRWPYFLQSLTQMHL